MPSHDSPKQQRGEGFKIDASKVAKAAANYNPTPNPAPASK